VFASVDVCAQRLAEHIERACAQTSAARVILVTHSMGGVVARAYVSRYGSARVAKLVTLAAPHHGSELARLAYGPCGEQLRPGSAFLRELNRNERKPSPIPIVSLFSWHDNFVTPQDSAALPCVTNIAVSGIGHLAMLLSRRIVDIVVRQIDHK
jgi:triacylglycerol lipase